MLCNQLTPDFLWGIISRYVNLLVYGDAYTKLTCFHRGSTYYAHKHFYVTTNQRINFQIGGGRGYHDGRRFKSSQFEIPCSPVAHGSFDPNVFRWLLPSSLDGEGEKKESTNLYS